MDFVRQQLTLIQERLAGLSPSQKMLTAALVVIMVMTLLYWGRFASNQDMVAVLPGPMTAESVANITAALGGRGIAFDASSGTVKVAADQQADAIAAITFAQAMPSNNSASAFDAMLEKLGPFDTQAASNARMKSGREARLAQVMMRWPNVASAIAVITEAERGGLVRAEPRISIDIMTKGGADKRKLADAAASLVINAVSGLEREHITINVDMTPIISSGTVLGDLGGGGSVPELRAKLQSDAEASIRQFYFNIPKLAVSVTADVDAKSMQEKINTVDPKNTVSVVKETDTETSQSVDAAPQNEPGVIPNVGGLDARTVAGGAANGGSKTEHTNEKSEVAIGSKIVEIQTPAGQTKYLSVSLRVPRSHFVAAIRGQTRKAEPTEEQIDAFAARELAKMRTEMKTKFMIENDAFVTAEDYFDVDALNDPANPVAVASAASGLTMLATGHAKEVSIGVLALASLFMVGRIVKRSAPPPPEPMLTLDDMPNISGGSGKKAGKGGKTLDGGFDIAGEVMEGGPIMMGRELDEEVLETSQMVEQVTGFVKDHPDAATQLIKRWMNRE